jgi:hypothetical protein
MIASIRAEMERRKSRRTATRVAAALAGLVFAIGTGAVLIAQGAGAMAADVRATPAPRAVTSAAAPETPAVASADATTAAPIVEPEPAKAPEPAASGEPAPAPERAEDSVEARRSQETPAVQKLKAIGDTGYEPAVLTAKAGTPIKLTVDKGEGCAAGFLMPELGIELDNSSGSVTKSLGSLEAGDYRFTCGMQMVEGLLRVK